MYQITICRENFKYLLKEGLDMQVLSDNGKMVKVMINVSSGLDVLKVFYAGAEHGSYLAKIKFKLNNS